MQAYRFDPIGLTRRDANRWLLAAAGLAAAGPLAAIGQPRVPPFTTPKKNKPATQPGGGVAAPSFLDNVLMRGREREYNLRVRVVVEGYQTPTAQIQPNQPLVIVEMAFQSAAIVFPVIWGCASSKTHAAPVDEVKGVMSFDDVPEDTTPVYKDGYPCGTRLGRWELHDKKGRKAQLQLDIPMTTWETIFDEAAAMAAPWPKSGWGEIGSTTFEHQLFIDRDQPPLSEVVNKWCDGNDPKALPPVKLAKFLAGKVLEAVQPTGLGMVTSRTGQFGGMDLKGANQTLIDGRGSEHDIACLLAAVYRNAGIPARVVVGHDVTETKGQNTNVFEKALHTGGTHLRSWVEFSLYDEINKKEIWIPVDVMRLRKSSNRVPPLEQPWRYFGSNPDLEDVMPFAFQYHPPTTVVAQGAVAFWGWLTLPQTQAASQWLEFSSIRSPNRSGQEDK